nr:hypothetical protein [Tanacetum cinerariifolium]
MLNKENYVPWSSRLLRYAKSRPNGKLIYNSIMNGPYVRRMIPEPGDADREVPVNEIFHEQTDNELTEKELKQIEPDDQAIQTILLGLSEDIYAAVDSCETAQEIRLCIQQMMKGSDIGIQKKKAKRNKYFPEKIAIILKFLNNLQPEWSRHNVGNQNGYNAVQNARNQVAQNAVQNLGVQHVGNQNGLIVVPGIVNQNPNGNCNVVAARAEGNKNRNNNSVTDCSKEEAGIQLQVEEFDLMATAADLDEIEKVNANYILMANLQQASTSGTKTDKAPVYDSDGSAENDSNVHSGVLGMEQEGRTVEQHPTTVEETRAYFESLYNNLAIEVEKVNMVNRKLRETNADLITELARYKNQEKCFEISQEKYKKLKRCYQKYVYQEQCLTKKINALHLSSGVDNTTKTRRPQPKSNTKNDRVPSAFKSSSIKNKEVEVE